MCVYGGGGGGGDFAVGFKRTIIGRMINAVSQMVEYIGKLS